MSRCLGFSLWPSVLKYMAWERLESFLKGVAQKLRSGAVGAWGLSGWVQGLGLVRKERFERETSPTSRSRDLNPDPGTLKPKP